MRPISQPRDNPSLANIRNIVTNAKVGEHSADRADLIVVPPQPADQQSSDRACGLDGPPPLWEVRRGKGRVAENRQALRVERA